MRAAAAVLYAVAAATLVALSLALTGGGLSPLSARIALTAGALAGGLTLRPSQGGGRGEPIGWWEGAALALFGLCSLRGFLWVVFFEGDEIRVLSPNNYGDLPLHLTYIRLLANGVPFWPENPILHGTSLTYPLGVDLLHSVLVLAGADLWRTFVWMGLGASALLAVALWQWGRGWAVLAFLGNGGLFGLAALGEGTLRDFQAEQGWKSFFLSMWLTQRGLLFALPAGLLLLISWRRRWFAGESDAGPPLPWAGEVLLYATLPLFHLHTFLALSFFLACWFAQQRAARREIVATVGWALLPASGLVGLVTHWFHGPALLGWHLGWMQDDPGYLEWWAGHGWPGSRVLQAVCFWPLNFGILPLGLAWVGWRERREAWVRATVWPGAAMFLLCAGVKFAVWPWDNTKLMIWAYLLMLPALWEYALARWRFWPRAGAVLLLCGSGVLSTLGGLGGTGVAIGSRQELEALELSLSLVPATARLVAHPTFNHPLLMLGHPVALGYVGHVSSHGYPYEETLQQVQSVLRGEEGWRRTAGSLGCRYLFQGREEAAAYPDSSQPWREEATEIAHGSWGALYDLGAEGSAKPDSASPNANLLQEH